MNPFKYGKEVSGYQFYDRRESCEEMYRILKDGSTNIVLRAPRRYGKTSLVVTVLKRLRAENVKCLLFDISRVTSLERFCVEYTAAVYSLWGGMPELVNRMKEYLVHLHPTFSFSEGLIPDITFSYGERMNSIAVAEVLDLPEKLAASSGNEPVVIAFDEFQDISDISKNIPLEAVFRSVIQKQSNARYVFLGSKTHMMKRMFGSKSRPFYKSALSMQLGKPPEQESEDFVVSRFAAEGINLSPQMFGRLLSTSENIPYFLQAMASLSFMSVEMRGDTQVKDEDIDFAISRFLESNTDYYDELLHSLSDAQRVMLDALAKEPSSTFDDAYRKRHGIDNVSTMHSALRELLRKGILETENRQYFIGDPFLARYIREYTATIGF